MHLKRRSVNNDLDTLNANREQYLRDLCNRLSFDLNKVRAGRATDYYSSGGYIQSPGNWIVKSGEEEAARQLRAVFNMRQDILIIENNNLHFIEAKLDSPNSSEQIENMLLLKSLYDPKKKKWACMDAFDNIDEVNLHYIKRTENPFRIENGRVRDHINIISWDHVFDTLQTEKTYRNFGIDAHREYLFKRQV